MSVSKYVGKGLNERLSLAGLMGKFARAVQSKNETEMIALMVKVDYTQDQASATAKKLMLDTNVYRAKS